MTTRVAGRGALLAVDDRGSGPAVVLVHGTAASRLAWAETVAALGDGVRTIAYDRRGYGDSEAPEPYAGTTVGEQSDDLAAMIESLDAAPAVLVGHGLGALIALDVMLHRRELTRAAVLIEPPLLYLSPSGPEAVAELRDAIERGARDGGPVGAVDAYLEHAVGPAALDLYGPERATGVRAAMQAFVADLAAGPTWGATRRELRSLDMPVTLVTGARSDPIWHELAVELDRLLPASRVVTLDSGSLVQIEAAAALAAEVRRAAG